MISEAAWEALKAIEARTGRGWMRTIEDVLIDEARRLSPENVTP